MSSPLRVILPWMLCCLVAGPVQAAAVSFLLDQSNELDDGVNYLQVRITDGRDGGFAEAGDITGFDYDCITSAYFGGSAVVPLPPTAWLFVSGLAALLPLRLRPLSPG